MDKHQVVDILNELLAVEQHSFPLRLFESTMFVSRLAVEDLRAVENMAQSSRQHGAWLSTLILELEGVPGPRIADPASADLHFQELHHVLPRLVREQESLIQKYALAGERLGAEAKAPNCVERILVRHREALSVLHHLCGEDAAPTSSVNPRG